MLTYCVSPPLDGSSTANSVVALGGARMVGVVGVEGLARDDAPAVHELVVGNVVHSGMAGDVALLLVVRLQVAEELHGAP